MIDTLIFEKGGIPEIVNVSDYIELEEVEE